MKLPSQQLAMIRNRALLSFLLCFLLLIGFAADVFAARPDLQPDQFRDLIHRRIIEACDTEAVASMNGPDLAPKIALSWKKRELGHWLEYERRIDFDNAGRLSLIEIWRFPRKQLGPFLTRLGNPDPPQWDQLTGGIDGGYVVAARKKKSLMVIRDGDDAQQLWSLPPYPLSTLKPLIPPPPRERDDDSGVERGLKKVGGAIKQLASEIVIDELTDIRGVPLTATLKTTWDFNVGDFTPSLRLQRRLRMEDDDTFTVVDSFEGDLALLLGHLGARSTTGVHLEAKRRVVIFRGGYDRWYKALFCKPFDPRKLPWNVEKLRAMPPGVRVVYPATTGFFLGESRVVTELRDHLPLKETFRLGLRGTFFLSMYRDFENHLELRFGGRVERVAHIQFRSRFERRYPLDPRRLLGSFFKLRLEAIRGARLFYQREIDLADDQQSADVIHAIKQGLKVSGYRLGGAAVGDFLFFLGEVDQRTLDSVITRNLPDFQWDHRVESKYFNNYWYGKMDLKLASIGLSRSATDDRWKLISPITGDSVSGTSGRLQFKKSSRLWVNRDRHDIQVHFLSSQGRNQAYPLTDFIEVFVRHKETRTTRRELKAILKRAGRTLGDDILEPSGFPGVLPDRDVYQRMDYRWHLILKDDALDSLAEKVLHAREDPPGSLTRKLARSHPYIFWRLRKNAEKGEDALNGALAHMVLAAMRWKEPVNVFFRGFPGDSYLFDWSIRARELPNSGGFSGRCSVPEEMRWAWKAWQELSDFDDLFEDMDLFD